MSLIPCVFNGQYCELSELPSGAEQVPQRPGEHYAWNATTSAWVVDTVAAHQALQASAQKALDATDMTAIRCVKAGVAFPSAWQTYVTALRAIVNGSDTTSTTLPPQPAYPAGT